MIRETLRGRQGVTATQRRVASSGVGESIGGTSSHETTDSAGDAGGDGPGTDGRDDDDRPGPGGHDCQLQLLREGAPDGDGNLTSNGTGSFSFADGLSTVGLADLTTFHFDLEEDTPNTTIFGLSDLKSFSATVGPGPSLTSLALETHSTQGPDPTSYPRVFTISSLNPPAAETDVVILGFPLFWTSGTVTVTSVTVPEPPSFTLALLGTLIAAAGWRRGRKARAAS